MPDDVSSRWRLRVAFALGGLLFALGLTAVGLWLIPVPWPLAATAGVAAGVFFAVMMARALGPVLRQAQSAVAGYDRDTVRSASRALRRGQVHLMPESEPPLPTSPTAGWSCWPVPPGSRTVSSLASSLCTCWPRCCGPRGGGWPRSSSP